MSDHCGLAWTIRTLCNELTNVPAVAVAASDAAVLFTINCVFFILFILFRLCMISVGPMSSSLSVIDIE